MSKIIKISLLVLFTISYTSASEEKFCSLKKIDMQYSVLLGGVGYKLICENQVVNTYKKAFCYSGTCTKEFLNEINQDLEHQGLFYFADIFYYKVYSSQEYSDADKISMRVINRHAYKPRNQSTYDETVTYYQDSCFSHRCSNKISMSRGNVTKEYRKTVELMAEQNNCEIIGSLVERADDPFYEEVFLCRL